MEVVLEFLRTTRVGCIGAERVPPEDGGRLVMERWEGWARPRMYIPVVFPSSFLLVRQFLGGEGGLSLSFFTGGWGPYYDRLGRSGAMENGI